LHDHQSAVEEEKPVEKHEKAETPAKDAKPMVAAKESVSKPSTNDAFFAHTVTSAQRAARPWSVGLVAGAIVLILAAVGLPWGWYAHSKAKAASQAAMTQPQNVMPETPPAPTVETPTNEVAPAPADSPAVTESDAAAKRQREMRARERARASESASAAAKAQPVKAGQKRVTVQVTYDENGRVTQASGGDATALRIARQKRFPAGKPGTTTVTIPIN
jgi:hypothetical protein